jgi:hypothetical protein
MSAEYTNAHSVLSWRCQEGHEWNCSYNNAVTHNHWCGKCNSVRQSCGIDAAKNFALTKEGVCLSDKYQNNKQKLRWRCKFEHEWDAIFKEVKNGTWCPHCYEESKFNLDDCKKWAAENKGSCLSNKYGGFRQPLSWKCKFDHVWETTPCRIRGGSWCHECGKRVNVIDGITIGREIAKNKNGKLLSDTYINSREPLMWECAREHIWEAPLDRIKNIGSWCPHCRYKNEEYCRRVFEHLFNDKFNKIRPSWLLNPRTGTPLELDGYNEYNYIAFEYNGIQHYKYHSCFHDDDSDLEYQQYKDEMKFKMCHERDILLIVIPYYCDNKQKIDSYIIDELKKHEYEYGVGDLANIDYFR